MPYVPNRENLAWAAGFFDGEGCTTSHCQNPQPRLRVDQSGDEGNKLLEKFKNALGFGRIYGPYKVAKNQTKVRWQYQAYGFTQTQAAVALLWIWLGDEKKKQAVKFLTKEYVSRRT